jgi:hypothetical protein
VLYSPEGSKPTPMRHRHESDLIRVFPKEEMVKKRKSMKREKKT